MTLTRFFVTQAKKGPRLHVLKNSGRKPVWLRIKTQLFSNEIIHFSNPLRLLACVQRLFMSLSLTPTLIHAYLTPTLLRGKQFKRSHQVNKDNDSHSAQQLSGCHCSEPSTLLARYCLVSLLRNPALINSDK